MAKRRLDMFSHLPEPVQKMFELDEDEEIVNFVDHFSEGGYVVLVGVHRKSEEERRRNRDRIYEVCSDIICEIAEAEEKKRRRLQTAADSNG